MCLLLHWQKERETCLVGCLVARAKETHLSNWEQHGVILNSCSDTVHVWVCAFVSIFVHTCRLSHFSQSCLNKISLIHILCCFLWDFCNCFCNSEAREQAFSKVQSWWLGPDETDDLSRYEIPLIHLVSTQSSLPLIGVCVVFSFPPSVFWSLDKEYLPL